MSLVDRIIKGLVPLEKITPPWDYERWLLRTPTVEEVTAAPPEDLHYRNHWDRYVEEFPDQGNRGTCVAHSNGLDQQVNEHWENGFTVELSEEDLYWKARKHDGLPDWVGEGSNNLGGMKARQKEGVCLEATYPTSKDKDQPSPGVQKPVDEYVEESCRHVIDAYYQVSLDPSSWKTCIAGIISEPQWEGSKPIVAAYKVTRTMIEYAKEHDGLLPKDPGSDVLGGHSSLFAAYRLIDGDTWYGNWNTWGIEEFDEGWLWFPKEYFFNGILLEGWISRNGPPITPDEEPSSCEIAKAFTGTVNWALSRIGSGTRVKAIKHR